MINFVIYEDKEIVRKNYVKVIHKFMGKIDTVYKIYEFGAYSNKVKDYISNNIGHNIYIIDIQVWIWLEKLETQEILKVN